MKTRRAKTIILYWVNEYGRPWFGVYAYDRTMSSGGSNFVQCTWAELEQERL